MSDEILRCAVIGVGRMGRHHARVYAQMDGVDLVGVVDHDPQRAADIVEEWGGEAFASIDALLAAGVIQLSIAGLMADPMRIGWPTVSGVVLVGAIVLYNSDHKENPLSPVVMGLCRVLIYVSVGQCFMTTLPIPLLIGALALLSYLIGLTYVAKQENLGQVKNLWPLLFLAAPAVYGSILGVASGVTLAYCGLFIVWMLVAVWLVRRRAPGDIPRAVVSLIAGISLLDAVLISSAGEPYLALLAVLGFAFTLILQRVVSGT